VRRVAIGRIPALGGEPRDLPDAVGCGSVPVVALVQTSERLRAVAGAATDASGFFAAMYAHVTAEVERRCARGQFEDPDRMVAFIETFAGFYIRAHDEPGGAPRCWRAAWAVADDRRLLVVQHLLLGINAHVNHDLPQAVVEVAGDGGDVSSVRGDFEAVNDVLAQAFGEVTDRLDRVARWTSAAAALGGGRLFNFSLRVARRQAWDAANRLSVLDAAARADEVAELDRLVAVLAYLITRPDPPLSLVLPVVRRLEERDPRRVTAALLAGG
jgi:hypothetical protein